MVIDNELSEDLIQPTYEFGEPNSSVILLRDHAKLEIEGKCFSCEAEVWFKLVPRSGIEIRLHCDQSCFQLVSSDNVGNVHFARTGAVVPGFISNLQIPPNSPTKIVWTPLSEPITFIGNDSEKVSRVIFHLFNFKEIIGTRRTVLSIGSGQACIEHVKLDSTEWHVELRSLPGSSAQIKVLKEEGGYGLTHIGVLQRSDGTTFSGHDAQEVLMALRCFLSFAQGAWCNPICPVGFDLSLNRVWGQWSAPSDPWLSPESWFDPHRCEQLVNLWPGFLSRWKDENWQSAIREVVYWYRNANNSNRGIDAGIILTQAALERLSYEYCVRERKLIESQGFKALRASDKLRMLLSSLNIPIEIPSSSVELTAMGRGRNWQDGPHALTEVRNSLVHPEHKKRGSFSEVYLSAWKLGLWYLELSLLSVMGYDGTYSNRMTARWVGQVEPVPWANLRKKDISCSG